MRSRYLQRICSGLAVLSVCGLGACQSAPEEEASSGTLDPHSSASRARLDTAQRAFSESNATVANDSGSDLSLKSFNPGGGDLALSGFNTKDLTMKGFGGARNFDGAKAFAGADKSFGSKMSPMGGLNSEFSNQALAGESGKTFFGKSYGTKAYQPRAGGIKIPSFDQPKIMSTESLSDPSQGPGPEAVSVEDIRNLLNR